MSLLKIYRGQALELALAEIMATVHVRYLALDLPEPDTLAALAELGRLAPQLRVAVEPNPAGDVDRVIIHGDEGPGLIFAGPPLGTELAALVSAIVVVGRGRSGLAQPTRRALASLARPVQILVFTTPT